MMLKLRGSCSQMVSIYPPCCNEEYDAVLFYNWNFIATFMATKLISLTTQPGAKSTHARRKNSRIAYQSTTNVIATRAFANKGQ